MQSFENAVALIREFKGERYIFGRGVLGETGRMVAELGNRAVLVHTWYPGCEALVRSIESSLSAAGVTLLGRIDGAAPNAPREDLARIALRLGELSPDVVVGVGGGSTIDATKAAVVLCTLGGQIEDYFGMGKVSAKLQTTQRRLTPVVAVQTAASSGAHLTKYSNITDIHTGQKKLIVDEAIVPTRAVFDYDITRSAPASLTTDGALDGLAHALEVLYDSEGKAYNARMLQVAREAIRLVVGYVERAVKAPDDAEARVALGLATDLGGYSIMLGGTNGPHLTSFSLVDVLSHGRACAIMLPYYTVYFAPAVEGSLRMVGAILTEAGLIGASLDRLSGRALGLEVARALFELERRVGFPTTLREVPGFSDAHIERALAAAKDPQLRMKLENMPVPMSAETVERTMRPVLEAARDGDLERIARLT